MQNEKIAICLLLGALFLSAGCAPQQAAPKNEPVTILIAAAASLENASVGTNVTEVLNWVAAESAEVGVVYATDAASSDGVEIIAEAPAGSFSCTFLASASPFRGRRRCWPRWSSPSRSCTAARAARWNRWM